MYRTILGILSKCKNSKTYTSSHIIIINNIGINIYIKYTFAQALDELLINH